MNKFVTLINQAQRLVFFGGAGVSVASGIPDFRSATGLYTRVGESVLSHDYLIHHTQEFYDFYWNHLVYPEAKPNLSHRVIAQLEAMGKLQAVVTQNVDGLHQDAGSSNVLELHGSVHRYHCLKCHKRYVLEDMVPHGIPICACSGIIRPDVVLFDEPLDHEVCDKALRSIGEADMILVAGTSLTVYPAAGFLRAFKGKSFVIVNPDPTPMDGLATYRSYAPLEEELAKITILQGQC